MRRRVVAWGAILLTGAAVVIAVLARDREPAAPSAKAENTASAAITTQYSDRPKSTADGSNSKPQPLPRSFNNTDVDGGIDIDTDGRIKPTRALRDLFDYYLSGVGEYAQSNAISAVKNHLRAFARKNGFSRSVRRQLLDLFDRYIAYRRAAAAYIKQSQTVEAADALRNLSDMRIAYLGGEMAGAFFGAQEQLARAAIARQRGQAGAESLTPAQNQILAPVDLARRVDALRKNGADEAAVAAAREQAVGRAATKRLEALDKKRVSFSQKLKAYRSERDRLMKSAMADTDRQNALSALRKRYFSARDIRRVKALDGLSAHGSKPAP